MLRRFVLFCLICESRFVGIVVEAALSLKYVKDSGSDGAEERWPRRGSLCDELNRRMSSSGHLRLFPFVDCR